MHGNSCGFKLEPAKLVEIECHCDIGDFFEDLAFIFLFSFNFNFNFYYLVFDTGFLCEALAVPQCALETRLTLDSEICLGLCPQGWDGRRGPPRPDFYQGNLSRVKSAPWKLVQV